MRLLTLSIHFFRVKLNRPSMLSTWLLLKREFIQLILGHPFLHCKHLQCVLLLFTAGSPPLFQGVIARWKFKPSSKVNHLQAVYQTILLFLQSVELDGCLGSLESAECYCGRSVPLYPICNLQEVGDGCEALLYAFILLVF